MRRTLCDQSHSHYCFSVRQPGRHLLRIFSSGRSPLPGAANFQRPFVCSRLLAQHPRKTSTVFWIAAIAWSSMSISASRWFKIYLLRTWRSETCGKTDSGRSLCASRTSACCVATPGIYPPEIATKLRCTLRRKEFRHLLTLASTPPGQRPRPTRHITLGWRQGGASVEESA